MEEDDLLWVLGAFPQPVFLTDGETVQWRNAAASAVLDPGASLQPMLQGTAFGLWSRRGTLRLSLPFGGALCDFSVRAMQRGLLFLADAPHEPSAAAGAALKASAILRRPLQNVMTAARELFDRVEDLEEPAATAVSSELNRGLYQLLRLCGQLTTGGELLAGTCKPERHRVDLTALLEQEAARKGKHAAVSFNWPQAVIQVRFVETLPQAEPRQEEANEGEQYPGE